MIIVSVLISKSDEHQRRSPDCVFFAFHTTANSRAGRPRKGRSSKASRMSTQSNFTTVSDGISIADTDVNRDDSIMSVVEPAKAAKSVKGAKRGAKARKPAAKPKRQASKGLVENTQVASSFLEPEDDDFEVKVGTAPSQTKGNKKRKSGEMSASNDVSDHAGTHKQEEDSQDQSRKRRGTVSRANMEQTGNAPSPPPQEEHDIDAHMIDAETIPPPVLSQSQRRGGKGGKKRGSSNVRKASMASTASKASLRAAIPPDEDIDAALEAELDRPLTDEEGDIETPAITVPKGRRLTRTKPGSRKATASVAPTRRPTRASTITVDDSVQDTYPVLPGPAEEVHVPTTEKNEIDVSMHDRPGSPSKPKQSKEKSTRKASKQQKAQRQKAERPELLAAAEDTKDEQVPMTEPQQPRSRLAYRQMPARNTRALNVSSSFETMDLTSEIRSPRLDVQTAQDQSGHETDASVVNQARTKRAGSKKAPRKGVKGGKKATLMSQTVEDIGQPFVDDALSDEQGIHSGRFDDRADDVEHVSAEAEEPKKEGKPLKGTARAGKTETTLPEPETFAQEDSTVPLTEQPNILPEAEIVRPSPQPLSALPTPTPVPSPQSSDAENQPPSSRPSKQCPSFSMQSPLKSQISCVPPAATIPVNSPSKNRISKLQTTFPWTAIEMEFIFEGTPTADKENSHFAFGAADKSVKGLLASPEKKLTVEQWIQSNAQRGEEKLRNECERLVGKFEDQGVRALRVLEGIVCAG